jgi:hypothetical protein
VNKAVENFRLKAENQNSPSTVTQWIWEAGKAREGEAHAA